MSESPTRSHRRTAARLILGTLATCVALGLVGGAVWRLLAPTGPVVPQDGYLFAVENPELIAGQDVVFALVTGFAGLAVGFWVVLRSYDRPVQRLLAALAGGLLGAVVTWQVGRALGPDLRTGAGEDPVPSPLDLHALGLLGAWPALTAVAVFLGLFLTAMRDPRSQQ